MRMLWAAVIGVAACGSSSDPRPQPAPTPPPTVAAPACAPTIETAARQIRATSTEVKLATKIERIGHTMIASCEAEAWTPPVLACIASARLDIDLMTCTELLTHQQWVRLQTKLTALEPPPPPAVVAPRPPRPAAVATSRGSPVTDDLLEPDMPRVKVFDCSQRMVNAGDAACRKQYCSTRASDPRCMVE